MVVSAGVSLYGTTKQFLQNDSGLKVTKKNYYKDLKKVVFSSDCKTFWSWQIEICTGWSSLTLILVNPRFCHNNIGKKVETV